MCKIVDMVLARAQGVLDRGKSRERLNKYWIEDVVPLGIAAAFNHVALHGMLQKTSSSRGSRSNAACPR